VRGAQAFKDHYATLGVSPDATRKQIRSARNRLLRKHHPDLNPGSIPTARQKTIDILLAAKVLLDEETRREYDRTYRYVRGTTRATEASTSYREPAPEETVNCTSCGRRNRSGRAYCLYCGAGIGDDASEIRVEEILARDLRRADPTGAAVHFGCGALLGLVVFTVFGFRAFAVSELESPVPLVIVIGIGVMAFGACAVRFRDKFWMNIVQFFFLAPLLILYLLFPLVFARQTGRNDGWVLFLLAAGVLSIGALPAVRRRLAILLLRFWK
jgi:hypothetical protein